ncbi:MAG: UvrD-helicase domain-containing protein [Bacteroidaceae bacterium]|nr:UvrD-helicase domain-containing protein [Bacteroidaceae bacterium]
MVNLSELNPAQQAAVVSCDSPSLVIAGAGSGKTRVLTYKIAYLLEQGYNPWNILALTFTNKAAREMQQRISTQVGADLASQLWMGTFHSIFSRILRIESQLLGFSSNFTIYDATDSKSLVKSIIREMQLNDKSYKPSTVCARISSAKNSLVMPDAYASNATILRRDGSQGMERLGEIYRTYQMRCRQANAMDFDDLLLYTWQLLSQHEEVRQKYQERFHYVLVDEYQDTNYAQHQIVWLLTRERQRVCVVGDDAQSIYSFRGANIDNILNFQQMYTGAKLFKLEQNYRSTQNIVSAANSVIHHNERQIRKDVFSQNNVGNPVEVCRAYSDVDETNIVARKIRSFVRAQHIPYSQIAVLYRTNAQSRNFEETLRREGLPYRIYGGMSFYQRKEVKDVIAYFRLVVNPNDEEAFKRAINYPARGIGQTTVDKILALASTQGVSVWDAMGAEAETLHINKGTRAKLEAFRRLIDGFHAEADTLDAYTLGLRIVRESGVRDDVFQGHEPEDLSRQENLQELMDGISAFVQQHTEEGLGILLTHYLQEVSLLSDQDEDDSEGNEKVTLMTIHSAKGLEFDVVFVVGLEENLFPSEMSLENPRQIEEERRLFYVAMTRARQHLILTYAKSRIRYGKMEFGRPSRFLHEIDSRYLRLNGGESNAPQATPRTPSSRSVLLRKDERSLAQGRASSCGSDSASLPNTPPGPRFVRVRPTASSTASQDVQSVGNLSVGARVVHDRFGRGVIERIEGQGLDAKATVRFDNVGVKVLLLRFARLTPC